MLTDAHRNLYILTSVFFGLLALIDFFLVVSSILLSSLSTGRNVGVKLKVVLGSIHKIQKTCDIGLTVANRDSLLLQDKNIIVVKPEHVFDANLGELGVYKLVEKLGGSFLMDNGDHTFTFENKRPAETPSPLVLQMGNFDHSQKMGFFNSAFRYAMPFVQPLWPDIVPILDLILPCPSKILTFWRERSSFLQEDLAYDSTYSASALIGHVNDVNLHKN